MFETADRIISRAVADNLLPCAAIAIGDGSGALFKNVYGRARVYPDSIAPEGVVPKCQYPESVAADKDTLFDLASLSKLVSTTFVALRLIENGVFCLSDELRRFFPQCEADKANITIKQLMTHTSGFPAHFHLEGVAGTYSDENVISALLGRPLSNKPGERVEYSCMGYILLGKIIEKITSMPLDALARELVFSPLSMKSTCYCPRSHPEMSSRVFAVTEYREKLGRYNNGDVHDENAAFLRGVSGNAGVFSDIDDMTRFALMLSRHGETESGAFLSRPLFDLAISNHTAGKGCARGLGFDLYTDGAYPTGDLFAPLSYGHTGFTGTSLYVDRASGFFVVMLTNRVHFTRASDALYRLRRLATNSAAADYFKSKAPRQYI